MDPYENFALSLRVKDADSLNIKDDVSRGNWKAAKIAEAVASLYHVQSSQDNSIIPEKKEKKQKNGEEESRGGIQKYRLRYHRLGGLIAATFDQVEAPEKTLNTSLSKSENYGGPGADSVIVNSPEEIMASMKQNMFMKATAPPPMSEEQKRLLQQHRELVLSQYEKSGLVPASDDWDNIYSNIDAPRGPAITSQRPQTDFSPSAVARSPDSPKGYPYSPLKKNNIRLITLLPSRDEQAQLQCHISQCDLDSGPAYEALSYTWGSARHPRHLRLSNGTIEITPNLNEALRYLRKPHALRVLWVDAICINQNDVEERNTQVKRMNTIYQRASEVIVWLGPETDTSQAAFSFLYSLQTHCHRFAGGWRLDFGKADIEGLVSNASMRGWEALAALMDRPWWSRAWVLQEVVLATRVKIRCGHKSFPWEMMAKAGTVLFRYQAVILKVALQLNAAKVKLLSEVMNKCQPYINAHIMRSKEKTKDDPDSAPPSITRILMWTRALKTTNPRDNVYAILNLLPKFDVTNDLFDPDYRLPVSEVYTRFAVQVLLQERTLSLLSLVFRQHKGDDGSNTRVHDLPSWVPDFDIVANVQPLQNSDLELRRQQLYTAAPPALVPFTFSPNLRTLTVYGFVVTSIAKLGETCFPSTVSGEIDTWKNYMENCHPMRDECPPGLLIDAFWRTIIADQWRLAELAIHRVGSEVPGVSHMPPKDEKEENSFRAHVTGEFPQPWHNRKFFLACNGMIGLAPKDARKGDEVVVLLGSFVPFIVRREAGDGTDDNTFTFVGESYIHHLMDGEVFHYWTNNYWALQRLSIR